MSRNANPIPQDVHLSLLQMHVCLIFHPIPQSHRTRDIPWDVHLSRLSLLQMHVCPIFHPIPQSHRTRDIPWDVHLSHLHVCMFHSPSIPQSHGTFQGMSTSPSYRYMCPTIHPIPWNHACVCLSVGCCSWFNGGSPHLRESQV